MRERGGIVIVIAHRPSALAAVDLVAVVQNGRVTSFGRKEDVVAKFVPRSVNTDPQPVEKPLERQAQRVPA